MFEHIFSCFSLIRFIQHTKKTYHSRYCLMCLNETLIVSHLLLFKITNSCWWIHRICFFFLFLLIAMPLLIVFMIFQCWIDYVFVLQFFLLVMACNKKKELKRRSVIYYDQRDSWIFLLEADFASNNIFGYFQSLKKIHLDHKSIDRKRYLSAMNIIIRYWSCWS